MARTALKTEAPAGLHPVTGNAWLIENAHGEHPTIRSMKGVLLEESALCEALVDACHNASRGSPAYVICNNSGWEFVPQGTDPIDAISKVGNGRTGKTITSANGVEIVLVASYQVVRNSGGSYQANPCFSKVIPNIGVLVR